MPLTDYRQAFPRVVSRLLETRLQQRAGHAYLFAGDDVEFLEGFVRAWIQTCACRQPLPDGDACGRCPNCTAFAHRSYPELYELRPQSKSRRILVEDVRDLEHQLGLTSAAQRPKFGLIVEADRMQEQAQNAFLKTLEEPPSGTMLVLASVAPRGLLPTIRSRCQIVSLLQNRKSYELPVASGIADALARLRRNAGAGEALAAAKKLAGVFATLREQAEGSVHAEVDERFEALAADDPALRKRIEEEKAVRLEAEYLRLRQEVMDAIHTWFRQQVLIAAGIDSSALPHPELAVEKPDPPLSMDEAEKSLQLADELIFHLSGNMQERLALDTFCVTVCEKTS